jgi:hypothetical protein
VSAAPVGLGLGLGLGSGSDGLSGGFQSCGAHGRRAHTPTGGAERRAPSARKHPERWWRTERIATGGATKPSMGHGVASAFNAFGSTQQSSFVTKLLRSKSPSRPWNL